MRRLLLAAAAFLLNASVYADSECGWCSVEYLTPYSGGALSGGTAFSWTQGEMDTNRIDVLVAFDSSAKSWLSDAGWTPEGFAEEAILQANSSLAMTGLLDLFSLSVVGVYIIEADLSGYDIVTICKNAWTERTSWRANESLRPLRAYRDEVFADIVVILTCPSDDESSFGASWQMSADSLSKSGMSSLARRAYVVCDISQAFDRYSITHEIGHIFGAGHADRQNSNPGPQLFNYSSGYYFSSCGVDYATIMGYPYKESSSRSERIRLPFFSSPEYCMSDSGVSVGTVDKNDNTRTIRETYKWVANFRVANYIPGWEPGHIEPDGDSGQTVPESEETALNVRIFDADDNVIDEGGESRIARFVNVSYKIYVDESDSKISSLKVSGLPKGLKYSAKSRVISGFAKKAGSSLVKIKVTAKGKSPVTKSFVISVVDEPSWLVGSYVGLISNEMVGVQLATATVSAAGKVSVKLKYLASNRTFSCVGFDSPWKAILKSKIKKVEHSFNAEFGERELRLDGFDGVLLQNPWGCTGIKPPKFRKSTTVEWNGLKFTFSGKGKVKVKGMIDGRSVSGNFQLTAGTSEGFAQGRWLLPIVFSPKKNFHGWAMNVEIGLTIGDQGYVTAVEIGRLPK